MKLLFQITYKEWVYPLKIIKASIQNIYNTSIQLLLTYHKGTRFQ